MDFISKQIFATDLDSGLNGEIEYSVVSGNENKLFLIDSAQGILAANAILNYEDISSYRFVVQQLYKIHIDPHFIYLKLIMFVLSISIVSYCYPSFNS